MTKTAITRGRLQEISEDGFLKHGESKELARMALAAMDSEPVAHISKSDFDAGYPHILARRDFNKACTLPVYAAQPAPEYPEVLPCPVLLEPGMRFGKGVKTRLVLEAIQRRAEHHAELEAMAPEERAEYDANIEAFKAMLPLPAPVVPDAATAIRACLSEFPESARDIVEECADIAENACRAAMLQAGNSPAQSDCCPAQNDVAPAQSPIDHGYLPECECSGCKATARICAELAGNSQVIPDGYVMVPKEPTEAMMLHNSGCQHHAWDDPDCAMRQTRRLIWSHMLAAAPQEVK
ncbi:TPA: hypothetical protein ACNHAG_001933 [Klebsiella pneumoniae]|uniref:hypothetical protein n=1 Tax=Klebsiella pneumoniae TaxID=573 RepID=UPI0006591518|nr:hypothetical protein [Klebsiella pneumoniae]QBP07967.1 hypothetical protein [Klebsiella phage ST16-OXA48phi5.3]AWS72455.1 hypothetical protein AM466_04870 [Klebsiella pneumoniae]AXZ07045.1 hypothetical protein AM454_08885 [Klebsiella pneumoniae]EIW9057112.1 hypothetical protein [Klebsiella pneumoniae]EIW9143538.1 hypothetical protein [Klebsiella pneumoniae]